MHPLSQASQIGYFKPAQPAHEAATNPMETKPLQICDLPKNVFSENGLLSSENFIDWLFKQNLSSEENSNWMKWYFMQQKFPPASLGDTMECDFFDFAMPLSTDYAISTSAHNVHGINCDDMAEKIFPCESIELLDQKLPKGIYHDGKVILQQQAIRSCVATCAAMLALDHGKPCNLRALASTNLGNNKDLISLLQEAGLEGREHCVKTNGIAEFQEHIQKYGSLTCGIRHPALGGHQIILDHIDNQHAVIRDPAFGWRVSIPTAKFLNMQPDSFIYITGAYSPSRSWLRS